MGQLPVCYTRIVNFFINLVKILSMQKFRLLYTIAALAALSLGIQGCKKLNGIDNNAVIEKPYGLFVIDTVGAMYNTNDGVTYKEILFPPDGFPTRSFITAGENILWVKGNTHLSDNNAQNFNPTNLQTNPQAFEKSMIFYVESWDRVYLSSTSGRLGCMFSDSKGELNSWQPDTKFDPNLIDPVSFTSFTQLKKGTVIAYDYINNRTFFKNGKDDNWIEQTGGNKLPTPAAFYLTRFNNTVIATDYTGLNGVWYSNDDGKTWGSYGGLPNRILYAAHAPFDRTLLVATDSAGVYELQGGTFVPVNSGLDIAATVRGITSKDDLYKNDAVKQYVYIATNTGIFRSEDLGKNWIKVKPGNFIGAY